VHPADGGVHRRAAGVVERGYWGVAQLRA
jgi:hypothetical protein